MPITLEEGYRPGCIGRIVQLHAAYYAGASGFGMPFELKVARGLCEFCADYTPGRDGLWTACVNGEIHGSVAIDGAKAATQGAHLRWFIMSDAMRGQGLGGQLLEAALAFADRARYRRVFLNTFAGLDAARHLYEKHGFHLVHEEPGNQWGLLVTEQTFVRGDG